MFELKSLLARSLAIAAAAILQGCGLPVISTGEPQLYPSHNETPIATNFETTTQLTLQASEHWNRAAIESARQVAGTIKLSKPCVANSDCIRFFVNRPCSDGECKPLACESQFSKIFFTQFVSGLVNSGQRVRSDQAAGSGTVELIIQPILFPEDRAQYRNSGTRKNLGAGVWAIKDVVKVYYDTEPTENPTSELVEEGHKTTISMRQSSSRSGLHWERSWLTSGPTPANEVVITATAKDENNEIIARNTSIYYFPSNNLSHFACKPAESTDKRLFSVPVVRDCLPQRCVTTTCAAAGPCK